MSKELWLKILDSYKSHFETAWTEILTWRKRYSSEEYPQKVVINLFYGRYTVNYLWQELNEAFTEEGKKVSAKLQLTDITKAQNYFVDRCRTVKLTKTHPNLHHLLNQGGKVGGIQLSDYTNLINESIQGNHKSLEEIEFRYLYYTLTDIFVFRWAGLGLIGFDKVKAVGGATGLLIKIDEQHKLDTYDEITTVLGVHGAAKVLNRFYAPLQTS